MSEKIEEQTMPEVVLLLEDDIGGRISQVVIDRGSAQGIKMGDRFVVFGIGPEVRSTAGALLGKLEMVRGNAEAVHVQEKMTTLRCLNTRREPRKKRTVKQPPPGVQTIGYFSTSFIEEETEEFVEELPFNQVRVGDKAKPI